jgi:hypothetical protein
VTGLGLVWLTWSATLLAQADGGTLRGTVSDDEDGAPLADVRVLVLPVDPDAAVREAETDVDGRYLVERLPPGSYALSVTHDHHRPASIQDVEVSEGRTAIQHLVMAPYPELAFVAQPLDDPTLTSLGSLTTVVPVHAARPSRAPAQGLALREVAPTGHLRLWHALQRDGVVPDGVDPIDLVSGIRLTTGGTTPP